MVRKRLLGCTASVLAVAAVQVHAEEAASTGMALEEVIVTAEKREADLQKTAIAITAITADALVDAGVSQSEDLNKLVPGLGIGQGGPSTQVYLRGVGNYGTNAFADPAVAFNIDGVYISRFSGISGNFYDIQRVEVLKGPQGTLYGRNATGGAINIVTNKPVDKFEAGVGLEAGNYSLIKANGFVNVPVSDTVAVRLAAQSVDRDGYQSDGYDDDESKAARLQASISPSDSFSLLLTGSYLELGGKGPVHVPLTNNGFVDNDDPWRGQSVTMPVVLPVPPPAPLLYAGLNRADGKLDVTVKSFSAEMNADLNDAVTLTLLGNFMDTDNPSKFYGPGFEVDSHDESEQKSLEARLSGDTGTVKWVGGLYYFNEDQSTNYWVDQGFLFNQTGIDIDKLEDTTYAAFTQATYSLTDTVRLTGGVRYTREEKEQNGQIFSRQPTGFACETSPTIFIGTIAQSIPQAATNGAGMAYPFPFCSDTMTGKRKWTDTSWKAGIDFDVTDDSMMYASVSRGFKAGGFFAAGDNSIQGNSYEPETLVAYAVGAKNRFLDGRLQLNGEVFFWDYKDHQESYLAPTSASGTFNFVTQRADAEIYGVDLELDALLSDFDQLGLKVQYLHAEYTDAPFINASPGPGNPSPRSVCNMSQDPTVPTIWYADCSGQQMPRSPDLSAVADYKHFFRLGNGGNIVAGANAQYSSSYWAAVDYNPLQKQDAYTMYGATLGYEAPDNVWSVTAYGANLGEEVVYSNAFMYPGANSVANGGAGNIAMVQLRAPRTYGVRANFKF